jgi:thymidylate synthase (FAD)
MNLLTYNDMRLTCLRATENPFGLLKQAAKLTMTTSALIEDKDYTEEAQIKFLKFIIQAEHTSILEHVAWTIYAENISRSLLTQLTRHRIASFTSASQHYADYSDMPFVVSEEATKLILIHGSLHAANFDYTTMLENNMLPREEARQVLPNASAVNLMMTINARSVLNLIKQRICRRNVEEMRIFADRLVELIGHTWPAFAKCLGPYCFYLGKCNQGKMSCNKLWEVTLDDIA